MADHFADRFWSSKFWAQRYFQGGTADPNAMFASHSGAGSITASLSYSSAAGDGAIINLERRRRRRKAWYDAIQRLQDGEKVTLPEVKRAVREVAKAIDKPALPEAEKTASAVSNHLTAVKSRGVETLELVEALKALRALERKIKKLREQEEEELMLILAFAA